MQYREDQLRTLDAIEQTPGNLLVVGPPGLGKGELACEVIQRHVAQGNRAIFVVHRREIVLDVAARLRRRGLKPGVIVGGEIRQDSLVQICSVQSLLSLKNRPAASLLVEDEEHHYRAEQWADVNDMYRSARKIGFTATPWRADGVNTAGLYDATIVAASYSELIAAKALTPCRVLRPDHCLGQDLAIAPLEAYQRHARGPTIVFVRTIDEAEKQVGLFRAAGIHTESVTQSTPKKERDRIVTAMKKGGLNVLVNVQVFTEGTDIPALQTGILARGCGHVGVYLQTTGRLLRKHKGKHEAILIDLTGASHEHGMPTDDRDYSVNTTPDLNPGTGNGQGPGGQGIKPQSVLGMTLEEVVSKGSQPLNDAGTETPVSSGSASAIWWEQAMEKVKAGVCTLRAAQASYRNLFGVRQGS